MGTTSIRKSHIVEILTGIITDYTVCLYFAGPICMNFNIFKQEIFNFIY